MEEIKKYKAINDKKFIIQLTTGPVVTMVTGTWKYLCYLCSQAIAATAAHYLGNLAFGV